jgi:hypothetical protein
MKDGKKYNEENLIPFPQRTKSEQRKIQSMGGIASGESRRAKKTVKECLKMYSEMKVASPEMKAALKASGIADTEEMTYAVAMALQFITAAMRGNSQMARLVMEMMGEIDQNNITVNATPIIIGGEDELQ